MCLNFLLFRCTCIYLFQYTYQVHGIIRRSSSFNTGRISHLYADARSHKMGGTYDQLVVHRYAKLQLYEKYCILHV